MSDINLISEIIEVGKQKDIDQNEMARRAGIRPETLSRAKKNPNIHLDTFMKLARVVGMRVKLIPDHPVVEQVQEGTLFPS